MRGFTLSELMIASAILLIAILGLLGLLINCIFMNESNNNLVTALNDAQYSLEQIKNLAYDQISNFTSDPDNFKFYNFTLEDELITPIVTPDGDSTRITLNVTWTERGGTRNAQLSTIIAE